MREAKREAKALQPQPPEGSISLSALLDTPKLRPLSSRTLGLISGKLNECRTSGGTQFVYSGIAVYPEDFTVLKDDIFIAGTSAQKLTNHFRPEQQEYDIGNHLEWLRRNTSLPIALNLGRSRQ